MVRRAESRSEDAGCGTAQLLFPCPKNVEGTGCTGADSPPHRACGQGVAQPAHRPRARRTRCQVHGLLQGVQRAHGPHRDRRAHAHAHYDPARPDVLVRDQDAAGHVLPEKDHWSGEGHCSPRARLGRDYQHETCLRDSQNQGD